MLRSFVRSLTLHTADDGVAPTTGSSPVADPIPTDDAPAPTLAVATADASALEPHPDEDEDADELSAADWQNEAARRGKQAAKYRTERNQVRADLAAAQARIAALEASQSAPVDPSTAAEVRVQAAERRAQLAELASEVGLPSGLLSTIRELDRAENADGIQAALGKLKRFLAPVSTGIDLPPSTPSTPPTLDQQIADADRRGDTKAALRLKALKLTQ